MRYNIIKKSISIIVCLSLIILLFSCKGITARSFDINALRRVSNLSTLECHFKNVAVYTKRGSLDPLFGPERQILEYVATINVGIDMKEIEYNEASKTIIIPKPKVISKNYDPNNIKETTAKYMIFSELKVEEAQEEISKSLDELVENVEQNTSIMGRAQNLAATQIDTMIRSMFGDSYRFNYSFK